MRVPCPLSVGLCASIRRSCETDASRVVLNCSDRRSASRSAPQRLTFGRSPEQQRALNRDGQKRSDGAPVELRTLVAPDRAMHQNAANLTAEDERVEERIAAAPLIRFECLGSFLAKHRRAGCGPKRSVHGHIGFGVTQVEALDHTAKGVPNLLQVDRLLQAGAELEQEVQLPGRLLGNAGTIVEPPCQRSGADRRQVERNQRHQLVKRRYREPEHRLA